MEWRDVSSDGLSTINNIVHLPEFGAAAAGQLRLVGCTEDQEVQTPADNIDHV
jgi:hypothetical protein